MHTRLQRALDSMNVVSEHGDYRRIAALLTKASETRITGDYVQKVADGRIKNPLVYDFILEYFKGKADLYHKLTGLLIGDY